MTEEKELQVEEQEVPKVEVEDTDISGGGIKNPKKN